MQPSVSVVMSAYNAAAYVEEALDSLAALDPAPDEIIVVDDGSGDGTSEKIQRHPLRLRYLYQQNQGSGAAKNRGVRAAASELVAFLDADDVYEKEALAILHAPFTRDPDCQMVFGHYHQFFSPDIPEELKNRLFCPEGSRPGILPGAMMCRRSLYLEMGGFPAGRETGDFVGWYLKTRERGVREVLVEGNVLRRRLHAGNKGVKSLGNYKPHLRMLKEYLERRRQSPPAGGPHANP
jgi:glycosyltransferase involved in cell wall biosynthesis